MDEEILFRRDLRRAMLAARHVLEPNEHARLSAQICAHLLTFLHGERQKREKLVVAFYWPIKSEVDIRAAVQEHWREGGLAALPIVVPDAPLQFCVWLADGEFETDPYGIPAPKNALSVTPDIIVIPVLAVDRQGYRLGYGGGFFDRTLAEFKKQPVQPLTLGIGFEFNCIDSIRPQEHDIPLAGWVSETGLHWAEKTEKK